MINLQVMLAKKNKLNLKYGQNRLVWQSSFQVKSSFFQAAYDFKGDQSQMAVVIAKKIIPRAIDRNMLRRKIYDIFTKLILEASHLRLAIRVKDVSFLTMSDEQLIKVFQPLTAQLVEAVRNNK